ncbi:hypothetical protein AB0P28_00570 [Pseudarthrobacter sp. NPDC089323]
MLHFPSANSAAHRPSPRDVAKLSELLDDGVWAFSNCRVDAPGRPVAEVDWFFYNVRHGTLMVSEWKGFPQRVVCAADTGARWELEGGLMVANPVEQVSRQLDAVRSALRISILQEHFPGFDPVQLRLMQSVYSPQVDERTDIERIRWGRVYGSLPDLAAVLSAATSPAPLILPDGGTRLGLAAALCALFRTSLPADVKAKLQGSKQSENASRAQRISAIHRQIAALHEELADLMSAFAPADGQHTRPAVAIEAQATVVAPKPSRPASALTDHQRMSAHLARSFRGVNGRPGAAATALEHAWAAVLADPFLHGDTGISVSLFGAVGTPLVKQHHGSLPMLLGMPLRKWCLLQTQAAGLKPLDVPGQPSNIRVR